MAPPNTRQRLCDICQQIDLNHLMPSARLQFPNAAGVFSDAPECYDDGSVRKHIRRADGTLQRHIIQGSSRLGIGYRLGVLNGIVSRRGTCPMCSFVATTFEKKPESDASSLPASATCQGDHDIYLRRYTIGHVHDHSKTLPYKIPFRRHKLFQRGWEIVGLRFESHKEEKTSVEKPMAFLTASSSSEKTVGEPTLLGRCRPALCDVSQYKSWLQMCTGSHPECSRNADTGTHPLRLIDVNNMCLVVINGDEKFSMKYLALSYVWGGGSKDFVLTRSNMQDYCRHQGLPALPKTISDAINLTSKMQERYLWVDSLCIISDDPQDKTTQIPAMASVYGCALLTIVAAAGQDVHHGLPGLRVRRSETNQAEIGNYHIMQSHMPYRSGLSQRPTTDTKWASRGWTYQEFLLSPRSLVFLDEQVLWHCSCAEWFEEYDFEHPNMTFRWKYETYRATTSLTIKNYQTLVSNYTVRELTFEKDIMDAFWGIMEAIPGDFFWGIPVSNFGRHLMWKQPSSVLYPKQRECGLQVPSWSWFAWKGQIEPHIPEASQLTIYRWQEGQLQQISTPDSLLQNYGRGFKGAELDRTIWSDPDAWVVRLDDIPDDVVLNEKQLIFWALVTPVSDSDPEIGDLAMCGNLCLGEVYTMRITWYNNIARREGCEIYWSGEWWAKNPVKQLIILE